MSRTRWNFLALLLRTGSCPPIALPILPQSHKASWAGCNILMSRGPFARVAQWQWWFNVVKLPTRYPTNACGLRAAGHADAWCWSGAWGTWWIAGGTSARPSSNCSWAGHFAVLGAPALITVNSLQLICELSSQEAEDCRALPRPFFPYPSSINRGQVPLAHNRGSAGWTW